MVPAIVRAAEKNEVGRPWPRHISTPVITTGAKIFKAISTYSTGSIEGW